MNFRLAVVGVGRMGKLHARVISEMDDIELVCVVDSNASAATAVAKQRNCIALTDVAQAVDMVDAAIISVPTAAHLSAAEPFINAGKSVLIEKPFTDDVQAGQRLVALAKEKNVSVQVGHTERFNPAALAVKNHAIKPKFIEAHRISPFTFRSADVGVVLDMMIHDIDLVLMLAGGNVTDIQAVGVNVIGKHEDICNARLTFDNGCVANLTASRLAIKTERKMRIFSEQAYVSVDYGKKVGIVITKNDNIDLIQMAQEMNADDIAELAQQVDYKNLLKVEELVIDDSSEPLKMQAQAFGKSVLQKTAPPVSADDGLAAVKVAMEIVRKIKDFKWDGETSTREGLNILDKKSE